jgi:hypothetical protein
MEGFEFSRRNLLRKGRLFDMQIAPFGAVSRAQGFTRDLMMTGDAYYEFIALSDMAAHVGMSVTDRWKNLLEAVNAEFAALPTARVIQEITVLVNVLDPDGQVRSKRLMVASSLNESGMQSLTLTLPRAPRKPLA